jgi:exo-beta-1,3-glucanase (GH17 family)
MIICSAVSAGISATQDYVCVGYQPYILGNPDTGTNPLWDSYSYADVLNNMDLIRQHFTKIRTWTIQYSNQHIIQAAHARGVNVAMGAWGFPNSTPPDYYDETQSKAEIDAVVAQAKLYPGTVTTVICGNENLQDSPNPNGLIQARIQELMNYARTKLNAAGLSTVKVTTCQTSGVWVGHPTLADCPGCDEIWCTIYPFWHGDDPGQQAVSYFQDQYNQVVGIAKGKRVVVGETGWATAGNNTWWGGTCKPSVVNASAYFNAISAWLVSNRVEAYMFEMFDEPWKYSAALNQESHFGIFEGWNNNQEKYAIPTITHLQIVPGAMVVGAQPSYELLLNGEITVPLDFYVIADTPAGIYTLNLNGTITKGIIPLIKNLQGVQGPINRTVAVKGAMPAAFGGKDLIFYAGAVAAGTSPGVPLDQITTDSPNILAFDTETVTVQ